MFTFLASMKKWVQGISLFWAIALSLTYSIWAQNSLESTLDSTPELSDEALGLVVVNPGQSLVEALDDQCKLLAFMKPRLSVTEGELLLDWVREGHTVWIYYPQVAEMLGFPVWLLEPSQITSKPEEGKIAGKKVDGIVLNGIATGQDPVLSGVGIVSCFVPLHKEDKVALVHKKGDVRPLLSVTGSDKDPLVAAYRREGFGAIVFKTLVWPEALSGARFQENLKSYSVGQQVAGGGKFGLIGERLGPDADYIEGSPSRPLLSVTEEVAETQKAEVEETPIFEATLKTGETFIGTLSEPIRVEITRESLKVPPSDLDYVEFGNYGLDYVVLRDGSKLKGLCLFDFLRLNLLDKGHKKIAKEELLLLTRQEKRDRDKD